MYILALLLLKTAGNLINNEITQQKSLQKQKLKYQA